MAHRVAAIVYKRRIWVSVCLGPGTTPRSDQRHLNLGAYDAFLTCLGNTAKFSTLRRLEVFAHGRITERRTNSILNHLPNVEVLILFANARAIAVDINILQLLPKLRVFHMDAPSLQLTMFSQFNVGTFAACKNSLKVLDLQLDNSFAWDAQLVQQLVNLECLSIGPCHLWDTDTFDALSALKNLRALRVRRIESGDSMRHFNSSLQHLGRLKYLAVLDSPIEHLDYRVVLYPTIDRPEEDFYAGNVNGDIWRQATQQQNTCVHVWLSPLNVQDIDDGAPYIFPVTQLVRGGKTSGPTTLEEAVHVLRRETSTPFEKVVGRGLSPSKVHVHGAVPFCQALRPIHTSFWFDQFDYHLFQTPNTAPNMVSIDDTRASSDGTCGAKCAGSNYRQMFPQYFPGNQYLMSCEHDAREYLHTHEY